MDKKIWYDTLVKWMNSLDLSQAASSNVLDTIKESMIEEILKVVENGREQTIIGFINENFPNYAINVKSMSSLTDQDFLAICTLVLIYVCFSNKNGLEDIRQKMCMKLENSVQENITEFLLSIQEQGDVFSVSSKTVTDEIVKFTKKHSVKYSASGDGLDTPVKGNPTLKGCESPLLEFLQTPKRKRKSTGNQRSGSFSNCDQLKRIKELSDLLVDEELEKLSLQEELKSHEIKCSEYEVKLKNKIDELELLKREWEQDICKNVEQNKVLLSEIEKSDREREKLSEELKFMGNYVNSLETEIATAKSEKNKLEEQLQHSLNKVNEYDQEISRISKINAELEEVINKNEAELHAIRDKHKNLDQNESYVESCFNETLDESVLVPENMGVVIEQLLQEKNSENKTLREAIDSVKSENECLAAEMNILKSQLTAKVTENLQLLTLNEKLIHKIDDFVRTCRELQYAKDKLMEFSIELNENKGNLTSETNMSTLEALNDSLDSEEQTVVFRLNAVNPEELCVIYDSSKDLTDSTSQFSSDDNETTRLTTIIESSNESEDASSRIGSAKSEKNAIDQFQMEEINREIENAKKGLIAFLKASTKNFQVLKRKEKLINEMTKQHEDLESRITSLTELNTRLTKEILNSKNISQTDSEYREKELDNLKLETESLKKKIDLLKEKLADMGKSNEILVNKKEECLSELILLREQNKSLTNDLQNKIMSQVKYKDSCLGFIRKKQETELELERTLKIKDEIDRRLDDLRKIIAEHGNKVPLEIMLSAAEQKFYVTSQDLLHATYSCLKFLAKGFEHQCFLIGQGDCFTEDSKALPLKKEQEENKNRLTNIIKLLNDISRNLDAIEAKCNCTYDLSDSLEVVPANNKTFDIINLEDKNINEKTYSVLEKKKNTIDKDVMTWIISPPSKLNVRNVESKTVGKEKSSQGESWVIPISPARKTSQVSIITNQKSETLDCKSSYASAVPDIEYSPPCKTEVKKSNSTTSFNSAVDSVALANVIFSESVSKNEDKLSDREKSTEVKQDTNCQKEENTDNNILTQTKQLLEQRISNLQKGILEAMKENEALKIELAKCEEKKREIQEIFDKRQEALRQTITSKYENQLEHLKSEMKALYNRELAKHKAEQSKLNFELSEQNKMYKNCVDEMRNQMWDLGEKLLEEQKQRRDLERNLESMKKKLMRMSHSAKLESRNSQDSDFVPKKDRVEESFPSSYFKKLGSSSFPTMPTEDEDEIFDNRCLEDMKAGICTVEDPEGRLTELQYRNSLCLPHLKSSYPAETQFLNPKLCKENELKFGSLNFGQESQSLTDSDHSMTRSLLPDEKGKRKEQPSYMKPGPPTPSKNGRRLSTQSGIIHITPGRVLKDKNDYIDNKSTPKRIRSLFTVKSAKRDSLSNKDENTAPGGSRGKKLKIFTSVKPFGGRDY